LSIDQLISIFAYLAVPGRIAHIRRAAFEQGAEAFSERAAVRLQWYTVTQDLIEILTRFAFRQITIGVFRGRARLVGGCGGIAGRTLRGLSLAASTGIADPLQRIVNCQAEYLLRFGDINVGCHA